ncbi:Excinuclease ABC, C subunit, N-terminal [Thalictrum thalictroides]|uniref:Excinuclease ABC, C subunit, N-terminal n=1 Tax=Thalictrum thalictroides TaxID=46969 RepID=A0A7J6WMQ0_THATH|nr:Excinuclease ABC, C subunit, N-terminal [Thalictrum thalictroides]
MARLLSKTFRSAKPHHTETPNKLSPPSSSRSSPSSWSVYLIISTNKPIKTYVGVTTDFSRRLKQHNGDLKGGAKASRAGRPWICACIIQGFKDHSDACELEAKWKISSRKLSRKRRIGDMNEAENEGSLILLQHRQAALDKIRVWFNLLVVLDSSSWCPHHLKQKYDQTFEKKTDRFWEYDKESNNWIEVDLPFDLVSCVNGTCTKVSSIDQTPKKKEECFERKHVDLEQGENSKSMSSSRAELEDDSNVVLGIRKRISLTRMSETSIWVTGESGSVYERFWNGVLWVIAPHDLPVSAGPAVSVLLINQTILALSEAGNLYQLHLSESSQLVWTEFSTTYQQSTHSWEADSTSTPFQIKNGVVSYDGGRAYFHTMNGSLVELSEIESQRWIYHGHPPGGDVAAIADAASIRPDVVFVISSTGKLYEFDGSSNPSWKKHLDSKGSTEETLLAPSKGSILYDFYGAQSVSVFLLAKTGKLVERRLYQRKWRWFIHGGPKEHHLTSIAAIGQDVSTDKIFSLFFATANGSVYEYRLPKKPGVAQDKQVTETWVNHVHPLHAKVARGIPGLQLQLGRILFSLDDGRLSELHLSGIGGENSGPTQIISGRRKAAVKYEWSILDVPETEGWNAEYCMEERGPSNCINGMRDEANGFGSTRPNRRKGVQTHNSYLAPSTLHSSTDKLWDQNKFLTTGINNNFRMRVMQEGRSYFFITDNGSIFEHLYAENLWLWLRHEHTTMMKGLLGNYNGSLFVVDTHGNLLIRERNENELTWINGTALRKGRQVVGGPPWDRIPGKVRKVTAEDALFFVSKNGRLVQFTVALRKFKWKDCRKLPNTKIAYIVDQEMFRDNIVFAVGRNGRLYQYNKVTELWHEHLQSPHLILSTLPGTAMRESSRTLAGSIFMVAEDGGLVEYQWRTLEGWNWIEHGTPYKGITFLSAPGPSLEYNRLFLVGSDGKVYLRYMDQRTWKWKSYGFPSVENMMLDNQKNTGKQDDSDEICIGEDTTDNNFAQCFNDQNRNCDSKVAPIRPIPFSEDSLIFELRDGRVDVLFDGNSSGILSYDTNTRRLETIFTLGSDRLIYSPQYAFYVSSVNLTPLDAYNHLIDQ